MQPSLEFNLETLGNFYNILRSQIEEFKRLRQMVEDLEFIPLDPIGHYVPISYKSFDGGKMGINFDPFDMDFIIIADSYGNEIMKFLVPKGEKLEPMKFKFLDLYPEIQTMNNLLGIESILGASTILNNPRTAMEIAEYACIFDKLVQDDKDPLLVMKDGLLRTKCITHFKVNELVKKLKKFRNRKLVGVAKSSKVLNLISSVLHVEKKIPLNYTGYIEIPLEIELAAYHWTGRGRIKRENEERYLYYAFGKLYVAKLSKRSNLLVTIEIPYDYSNKEEIYSKSEIHAIIGHLIRDSEASYPILGYPQTIMRAHEKAVRTGFTSSIWKDKIIERILEEMNNPELIRLIREHNLLREFVDKGSLGGI